jgi:hypothetical protein
VTESGQHPQRAADTIAAVLPYAVWMVAMSVLPATAGGYAVRTAATAAALALAVAASRAPFRPWRHSSSGALDSVLWGLLVGAAVCVLWIWPERFQWYREFSVLSFLGFQEASSASAPSPYDPATCGWPLTLARIAGSAFVIAPVEEMFFRSFLYRWLQKGSWTSVVLSKFDVSAFFWTVAIFALEHHTRIAAGAMAGVAYGLLAVRKGVGAAVLAHVVTNLALGLYVVKTGEWGFW